MPDGFREVSKDEFFATVGQTNVHPRPEPDITFWEAPNRQVLGKTTPGYLGTGAKAYFVAEHFCALGKDK